MVGTINEKKKYKRIIEEVVYSRFISESKQNHGAGGNIKSKARELRKNLTEAEKRLWSRIGNKQINGLHFRRQHTYGIYILDFYCFKANLVIEIDGKIHLKRNIYDRERTKYIENTGLKLIRFSNEDIEKRIEWVLEKIQAHLY